jgi:hypothetical protein
MNARAIAHGRAAHSVLRWLHSRGRDVPAVSLHQPVKLDDEPAPRNRDQIEDHIRLALAVPAAEMIHLRRNRASPCAPLSVAPPWAEPVVPLAQRAIRYLVGPSRDHT